MSHKISKCYTQSGVVYNDEYFLIKGRVLLFQFGNTQNLQSFILQNAEICNYKVFGRKMVQVTQFNLFPASYHPEILESKTKS